ncbi:MAG TPA: ATP-binding protein [Gemmatimonadaceae bacterium]|nr:ATP-binding protein [Gemmatimonadaceae bacterium]
MAISLNRALLGAVGVAILAGMIPAAVALDRRLRSALEDRARADLALAPRVLADRMSANASTMMMYAKDIAHTEGLATAVATGDRSAAIARLDTATVSLGGDPVLVGPGGESWAGPKIDATLVERTRAGEMPVVTHRVGRSITYLALAPIERDGRWVGAAGLSSPLDERLAGTLSGLTRAGVVLIADSAGPSASTLDSATTAVLARAVATGAIGGGPAELRANGRQIIGVTARLEGAGTVVFVRLLDEELAVLPELRRVAALSALVALLIALALGAALAARIARPVHELAGTAAAFAGGDLRAPVPVSDIREVAQVAMTFDTMRRSLAARLAELGDANAALTDRNARLTALQADLMQRDRLAATGRLVAQLAHEIRNPVASLRNCLELIRRRVDHDPEAREFADLAIDELLRMHELAEQMLDINRPHESGERRSRPVAVARDVARLAAIGPSTTRDGVRPAASVIVVGDDAIEAAIPPDALKQVLTNLVQNARDAAGAQVSARIEIAVGLADTHASIDVRDDGPGIPSDIVHRVFDPFFTTKDAVHGVGLGLFVAEGLVRAAGGRIIAANAQAAPATRGALRGAWFRIELPIAAAVPATPAVTSTG